MPIDVYAVKFYPYSKPGVDPVFALAGGRFVSIGMRNKKEKC